MVFAIHWHESVTGVHVFPIVNLLPHPIPLGHPRAPAPSTLSHVSNLDWRSVSHMVIYMFQCHSPKSSHPCLSYRVQKTVLYICESFCLHFCKIFSVDIEFKVDCFFSSLKMSLHYFNGKSAAIYVTVFLLVMSLFSSCFWDFLFITDFRNLTIIWLDFVFPVYLPVGLMSLWDQWICRFHHLQIYGHYLKLRYGHWVKIPTQSLSCLLALINWLWLFHWLLIFY